MLRRFHDEQSLHDANVFTPAVLTGSVPWKPPEVVIVAQQVNTLIPEFLNTLAILHYSITADPIVAVPLQAEAFHGSNPIWLYDEVDVVEPGVFSHEILVSDGRVIKLLFRDFNYHIAPLCLPTAVAEPPAPPKERMASA